MEFRKISEDYSVSGQITADDVKAIRDAGFRSIICNRPDSEDGAVPHGVVEEAARAAGLEFRYLPAISGQLTQDNVDEMAAALNAMEGPVFAYCRSGTRCTNLHMLVQQQKR